MSQLSFGDASRKGLLLRRGSMVDATIIAAPSSTRNADGQRDPEMHQTSKGKQRYFGMKAHIGADVDSGLAHTVVTTPANESDVTVVDEPLHGNEEVAYADAGYMPTPRTVSHARRCAGKFAARRGRIQALPDGRHKRAMEKAEHREASIRAEVEHPFRSSSASSDS